MEEVTVDYRGKRVTAALSSHQTLSGEALPGSKVPMWHVTIAGTALTKLPALPSDTEEGVRQRVLQWLQEHPDMLDRDQIVLGGG
ncbi:MAG TPA: hypothetical protein VFY42_01885 [Gemmatimonadales bacterium]|nr:hypothetical protein [Gemmatimonadales bacterium]